MGLLLSAIAGGLTGVGDAAKMGGEYLAKSTLQQEMADLQAKRDAVLNEYAVSMERDVRQPFQTSERQGAEQATVNLEQNIRQPFQAGQQTQRLTSEEARAREDRLSRESTADKDRTERAADSQRRHSASMASVGLQSRQVAVAEANLKMLQSVHDIDIKTKKSLDDLRTRYLEEKDPDKKAALGDQYLTLSGKITDKFEVVKGKDAMGEEKVVGFQDKHRGVFIPLGANGPAGGKAPAAGEIREGTGEMQGKKFRFKGGDPKQQSSWEEVKTPAAAQPPKPDARAGTAAGGLLTSQATGGPDSPRSSEDNRRAALQAELATLGNDRNSAARRRAIQAELNQE